MDKPKKADLGKSELPKMPVPKKAPNTSAPKAPKKVWAEKPDAY